MRSKAPSTRSTARRTRRPTDETTNDAAASEAARPEDEAANARGTAAANARGTAAAPPATTPPRPSRDGATRPKEPRTIRERRLMHAGRRRPAPKEQTNVLREGLRLERMPEPFAFVLFGATGDLAHRKVLPALYQLWRTNLLPHECRIIASGRRAYTDESFRQEIAASLHKYSRTPPEEPILGEFLGRIDYHRGDLDDDETYRRLSDRLDECDREYGTHGNRLYYLAIQPSAFAIVIAELGKVGLDHERHDGGWRRIVIEKPFGRDLDSAIRLNREVGKVFRESQIYRIDHYLGKETVRNLLVFRFGNGIFEPIWNRRYVDHVQITMAESIGVEDRGAFYEETGASRDVLQNHLMQLLALVAMEPPVSFEADALRDEKVKVIRAIGP
ncbi:MAG TPA: glucose-6-phosphate dehydrogenase, partial [Candidatus Limnocylindrales bacterium]|nr:glucose-6-phosphate dehydrogenase [Candidatus Limnocylindrales bacterium]